MSDRKQTDKSAVELDERALDDVSGGTALEFKMSATSVKLSPTDQITNKYSPPISDGTSNIVIKH